MAGSAMILPECRWMWDGVERADSLVLNPHKWLGAAFDCSLYYVRDPEHLVRVMSTSPSYLRTAADGQVTNYRDWGIALGRRFRALKLWCLIRVGGRERACRPGCGATSPTRSGSRSRCAATPDWRVVAPVPLQTVCVVHEPPGLDGRGTRRAHASLGRAREPLRGGVPHAGGARRAVGGARVDRRGDDRARGRGGGVGGDAAGGGGVPYPSVSHPLMSRSTPSVWGTPFVIGAGGV